MSDSRRISQSSSYPFPNIDHPVRDPTDIHVQ